MNSQDYWHKREEKWIAQQIKDDAKQSKVIAEKYQRALDQIEKEISANWERFAGKEGVTLSDAKKMALEMDVKAFARKAKEYVKNKDFSKTANDELRLYNVTMRTSRLELLKKQLSLELLVLNNDMDRYYAKTLTEEGNTEAERQAGILGETVFQNYTDAVDSIVNASFQGATFSERIWGNGGALKADLDRLLIRSVTQGRNPRELARELRNIFDSSRYEAERLMRTETARVQVAIQEKSYQEYGIEEFEFVAEPSACDACKPLDGKVFEVSKMTIGLNAPPIHPHCRCSTVPHVDREALERRLAEIDKVNEKVYNKDEPLSIEDIKKAMNEIDMTTATAKDLINLGQYVERSHGISDLLGNKEKLKEIFSKYRDMGGSVPGELWYNRSNKKITKQLQEAFSYYPKKWANYIADNDKMIFAGKSERGFFQKALVNKSGYKLLKGADWDMGVSIYSSGERATTAFHEIGHMVDYFNPNLIRIEREFVSLRTKGEEFSKLADIFPGSSYRDSEKVKRDNFINPYIGKDYGDRATEVLSMGLESIFEPGNGQLFEIDKDGNYVMKTIADDSEYLHLIIGLILKG